jgi:hypothetical protein
VTRRPVLLTDLLTPASRQVDTTGPTDPLMSTNPYADGPVGPLSSPENRKVGGSTPPLATTVTAGHSVDPRVSLYSATFLLTDLLTPGPSTPSRHPLDTLSTPSTAFAKTSATPLAYSRSAGS